MPGKTGFTLIELSIVIVIIGLVIGGVMVGNDLIKSAQRRDQIAQFEMFQLAVSTFKIKYGGLAGDADNASAFFTGVSDGNGNGMLQLADGTSRCDIGTYGGEMAQFFIHLSKANLLDRNYTGGSTIDIGYPSLPIKKNCGFIVVTNNATKKLSLLMRIVNSGMPNLNTADDVYAYGSALNAEETMFMDIKSDDANPAKGRFTAATESGFSGAVTPCNDGTNYYSNVSTSRCRPAFDLQY